MGNEKLSSIFCQQSLKIKCVVLFALHIPWRKQVSTGRDSQRDEERHMSEAGVPWVIANPFH